MRSRFQETALLLALFLAPAASSPQTSSSPQGTGPATALERTTTAAERALKLGETQIAESHYREALLEGWLLMGELELADGDPAAAKDAFLEASTAAVERRRPLTSLALTHLDLGEAPEAVDVLLELLSRDPKNVYARRLLAQALFASGRAGEAVQALEEAREVAPEDLETAFTLATAYLRVEKTEEAAAIFEELARERPIPQTWILIGRTYRDHRQWDAARAALEKALELDPDVRRGHFYLGTLELLTEGRARLDEAIAEFEAELRIQPEDPLTHLYLGIALAEGRRFAEAVPVLEVATRSDPPQVDAFLFLGRGHLGLRHAGEAAAALRRALELGQELGAKEQQLSTIHYQLALALRQLGERDEANVHFEAARQLAEERRDSERENLRVYLSETVEKEEAASFAPPKLRTASLAGLSPETRRGLREETTTALGRVYSNLGVLYMQGQIPVSQGSSETARFARAAGFFARAAEVDPDFPRVWYSLGVALFNAQQYGGATEPLERALDDAPGDVQLQRMLAMASLETGAYERAAELLVEDPERLANPSLDVAYATALVRGGQAELARPVFDRLLRLHGDWPELNVLLGQTYAQEDDYEQAVRLLEKAIAAKPDVAEAHGSLGLIYLRQGRLDEAEAALRRELEIRPGDLRSLYHLATVLDLHRKTDEAVPLLREVLRKAPDHANARYLLGKILLTRGEPQEAAAQLEAAAELSPEDPNIHYQLGQAYQRLGKRDEAGREFELFRELKKKERGGP